MYNIPISLESSIPQLIITILVFSILWVLIPIALFITITNIYKYYRQIKDIISKDNSQENKKYNTLINQLAKDTNPNPQTLDTIIKLLTIESKSKKEKLTTILPKTNKLTKDQKQIIQNYLYQSYNPKDHEIDSIKKTFLKNTNY